QLAPVHSCGRPIDSRRGAPRTLHSFPTRRSSDLAPVEALEHYARIVGEPAGDVAIGPAAEIVERRGQVPVIERAERLDAGFEQAVDEALVMVEPGLVHPTLAFREDAAPGDREAVGLHAKFAHEADVLAPAAILVAGDVARVAVQHHARPAHEAVPDARARAVGQGRAFDLVRRGRAPPKELLREANGAVGRDCHAPLGFTSET